MTPAQARDLAEDSLRVHARALGISPDNLRCARDDAYAPAGEMPAAALRRVWLWALYGVLRNQRQCALAAQVSRPSVQRAVEVVEAWQLADADPDDVISAAAELAEGLARGICAGEKLTSVATRCAISDRQELKRRRTIRNPRTVAAPELRSRDLHRERVRSYAI